jgi:hypothetical protein
MVNLKAVHGILCSRRWFVRMKVKLSTVSALRGIPSSGAGE